MSNANQERKQINVSGILKKIPNRFLLCVAASKRARQLKEGVKALSETEHDPLVFPIRTALKEIDEDKLKIIITEEVEEEKAAMEELDQFFEKEAEEERLRKEEKENEKKTKDKSKSKSKSLAA